MRRLARCGAGLLACFVALAAPAAGAGAPQCHGVSFAPQIAVDGSTLVLNGLGLRQATIFRVNVYVAALYLPRPAHDPQAILDSPGPAELVLHFVRNVGARDLREHFLEDFGKSAPREMPALRQRIGELDSFLSDVKSGERMVFVRLPGSGVRLELHGVRKTIAGSDFGRALFSIWLGSTPPNPELKTGLLGGGCG